MGRPKPKKIIILQDVPISVAAALGAQLRAHAHMMLTTEKSAQPDLVICGESAAPLPPAVPILRLAPPDRLGILLADICRALDEPALAVAPFMIENLLFNPATKTLTPPTGDDIALTERETGLLLYLARHAPQAVSRDDLLSAVWQYQDGIDTHTLETHIYRLRQKISREDEHGFLQTRDDGYALTGVVAVDSD